METVKTVYNEQRNALEQAIAELESLATEARAVDDEDHRLALRLLEHMLSKKRKQLERIGKVRFVGH